MAMGGEKYTAANLTNSTDQISS